MTNSAHDDMLRHATVRWLTDPPHGLARVRVDSGAFAALPLSVPGGEPRAGETTPGELLAAAYSAFMATNLA
jgi:organic hydroperoxide reductase OsmC/OhrA